MRSYGLKPDELKKMRDLFQEFFGDLSEVKIFLFGSRAKGTHKPFSDINIAIKTRTKDIS